jgi:hypothetical protein
MIGGSKMKCEKCLSRTNCQFLGTHKKAIVEDCTAFRSEEQYVAKIKAEAIKEFAEKIYRSRAMYGQKDKFNKTVFLNIVDQIAKEMGLEL